MKPKKKETVSVQEIMNNPVEGGQRALRMQREGVLGWLSYVGYMCLFVAPIKQFYDYWTRRDVYMQSIPLYGNYSISRDVLYTGLILSILIILKSKYPLSKKARIVFLTLFCVLDMGLLFMVGFGWPNFTGASVFLAWSFLIYWYLRYFYCKAKDGYQHVWLKVILCSLIPFAPLFWIKETEYSGGVMGVMGGSARVYTEIKKAPRKAGKLYERSAV